VLEGVLVFFANPLCFEEDCAGVEEEEDKKADEGCSVRARLAGGAARVEEADEEEEVEDNDEEEEEEEEGVGVLRLRFFWLWIEEEKHEHR
jgi:hypothetical protein